VFSNTHLICSSRNGARGPAPRIEYPYVSSPHFLSPSRLPSISYIAGSSRTVTTHIHIEPLTEDSYCILPCIFVLQIHTYPAQGNKLVHLEIRPPPSPPLLPGAATNHSLASLYQPLFFLPSSPSVTLLTPEPAIIPRYRLSASLTPASWVVSSRHTALFCYCFGQQLLPYIALPPSARRLDIALPVLRLSFLPPPGLHSSTYSFLPTWHRNHQSSTHHHIPASIVQLLYI